MLVKYCHNYNNIYTTKWYNRYNYYLKKKKYYYDEDANALLKR